MIAYFFVLALSTIPKQYQQLANQALKDSQKKIPRELREETKYPGEYESSNYHFKLLKTLTSSNTNDIKGFATDGSHCAIVKRKYFKLQNNFIFFEPKSQTFYKLDHVIASENNVLIYNSIETNIFNIMTNFELRSNLRSPRGINNPNTFLDVPIKWDLKTNRPELEKFNDTEIEIGFGTKAKISMDTILRFNSILDVKMATSIQLESLIGGELIIPDDTEKEFSDYQFYEFSIELPNLNLSMDFMGIQISLVFNFNFDVEMTDMVVEIPVGFDLFKGYKMIASKYFEISKYSKVNPDWKIELISLPEINTISDVAKSVTSSSFSAKFQVKPYFTLDVNIASINMTLEIGLEIPFIFDFAYNTEKCMFPYVTAMITFPFQMYYHFSGLSLSFEIEFLDISDSIEIIEECGDEKLLIVVSFGPFCIGGSETFMEGSDSFIQDASKTAYHITTTNFYETRREGIEPVNKQIIFSIRENGDYSPIIEQRFHPYSFYDKNQSNDVIMIVEGIPEEGVLQWNLNYKDSSTGFGYIGNSYASVNFSDLILENNHTKEILVSIVKNFDDPEQDITYFTTTLEKCQTIQPGKVFLRKWKYVSFLPYPENNVKYSMIYFTQEGKLFTNKATFLSSSMANLDFAQVGDYVETDESYNIHLDNLYTIVDSFTADIDIYLNYEFNNEARKVHLGSYFVPELENATYYSAELMGLDEISFDCLIPRSMNANVSVSGKIYYTTSKTIVDIDEQILFENDDMSEKEINLTDGTIGVFNAHKITPSITADCSAHEEGITPSQEILAETFEIVDINMSNSISIHFRENEMFKLLRISIPERFYNTYLGIITPLGNIFRFLYKEKRTTYNDNFFFFNVSSNEHIDIPIRRNDKIDNSYRFQLEFFKLGSSELVILDNTQGWDIEFDDDEIQRAFIIPTFKGSSSILFKGIKNENNRTDHYINLDSKTCLYFLNYTKEFIGNCTIFLSYSYISDSQPSIAIDLSYMEPLFSEYDNFSFTIYCNNGIEVTATIDNYTTKAPITNGKSNIILSKVGLVTFTPICKDKTGIMCQITYDTPSETGYHFIRYPNRDGISITGAGFLAEVIPVVSNQSFVYYKTFKGAIMTYREYPPDPVTVKMVVDDLDYIHGYNDPHRRMCLVDVDKPHNKIPFSRKYFTENMQDFIDLFAVKKENFDISHFENDEDGCILFNYQNIESDDIKEPPREACDLPTTGEILVDTTNLQPNFVEKSIKKKNKAKIAGIAVGCVLGAVVVVLAIIFVVHKMKSDDIGVLP